MKEERLRAILEAIKPLDELAMAKARERENKLTKPLGSLGRLEEIAVRIAGITGMTMPDVEKKAVVVFAADHGVVAQGVSLYPKEVTAQMVMNFVRGGAAISVLSRHCGAKLIVIDVGVAAELPQHEGLILRKIAWGTRDLSTEPAMTREQALEAIGIGVEITEMLVNEGVRMIALGDMGIGNTTPSAAIAAALMGKPAREVTGRGTGLDDERYEHKVAVIETALNLHRPNPDDPIEVLSKVGGFEIGALVGVVIACAARRIPVVLDGFITTAAAAIAFRMQPLVQGYMFAGHISLEPGHRLLLDWIGLEPILNLNMRLGEGTGAVLAMHVIDAACKLLSQMATFDEAGVSGPVA
ncbi:MAG: nicotinate-nucleotide--dimethylbenzimidazole phosphoribosyltransferase [Armatimonadota bacterium]|nr:nicotinate-nucleotide--dimethylbenzimidazole phosphoribosyltransferase [Armatimonadota bacterium]MCX7777103.1 nicotinate-nucleotide--dimethylbenzimidazole phosphoribosyltransferase [Armatimonadota bacterium]MDW8025150.1 nicotinate-nucleotide--dimethylbenzimidazole phosphoribosyltransferase [Armatimonadota bacterium]